MSLDPDLQALSDKIDRLSGLGDKAQFSPEQQGLLDKALAQSQRERHGGVMQVSHFRQELDFFVICLGYGLVAFAALVMLRWSSEAPLGGPGVFGLAFLAGVSGALFRAFYARPKTTHARGLMLVLSGFVVLISLIALTAAHAIGGVLGIVLGAIFFRSIERRRQSSGASLRQQSSS
ncbi:hypothetical protein [Salinisphaera sp.]|uniref:hypothetical protein n=2 Tax=Salinisphaera sp. TaxID=1914330 RepID=UPI000C61787A|nr:hypothetical protein [Salinisphaera sp.]MAS09213.1 hypothetical protein [Salinisphaera sp.]|tara:strand:+ start:192 stop:722 length:531 start_codon:yes stop_codon:yes gene_type:complete